MQKILILSIITIILSSCFNDFFKEEKEKTKESSTVNIEENNIRDDIIKENQIDNKKLKQIEEQKQKIEALKKRLELRWLIIKWDINLKNKEYTRALARYLQISKEIPDDQSIIQKIAETYYGLHNYSKANEYYEKIKDYNWLNSEKAIFSMIQWKNLNIENIDEIKEEINTFWLDIEKDFYYKNSIECARDFSQCKQNFADFFEKQQKDLLKSSWTWSEILKQNRFEKLYKIETALENYKNFKVDDLWYKWALVSWAFFENWFYKIAIETSKKVLEEKPWYKPLLKIIAKSHYELWEYEEAKKALSDYNKIDSKDAEISFFMWVVYEKLKEYILSTIFLKKALDLWYNDSIDINKRILYNYYELWELDRMLETFKQITKDDNSNIDDFNLAIYYNLINEKLDDALEITKAWLEKFPESDILNAYMWWILVEKIETNYKNIEELEQNKKEEKEKLYLEAEAFLDKWLEINSKNPMLNLVKGKLEMSKWILSRAFIYFKKTISLDESWEFAKIAEIELEKIEVKK